MILMCVCVCVCDFLQLMYASLSHTHNWYEVGMLKVSAEHYEEDMDSQTRPFCFVFFLSFFSFFSFPWRCVAFSRVFFVITIFSLYGEYVVKFFPSG